MAEARLVEAIKALVERQGREPGPALPVFKAPQFDGDGDVEYYIQQFIDVAAANQWTGPAQLLYLRESLREGARDCGKAPDVEGVFTNLRARYGLTPREARARLTVLRKEARTTLQEHATEVEHLVRVTDHGMNVDQQRDMAVETFASTLNHPALQRHLLAVDTPTLEVAVRAGGEYLQIRPSQSGTAVRTVDDESSETDRVSPVTSESLMTTMIGVMQGLLSQLEKMAAKTEQGQAKKSQEKTAKKCWGCQKEGHLRKNCPTQPWETTIPRETRSARSSRTSYWLLEGLLES